MKNEEQSGTDQRPPFAEELARFWGAIPDKGLFGVLLVAWLALFHLLGNSTFGYKDTPSLFLWLNYAYTQNADDAHGKLIPFVVLALFWVRREELIRVSKSYWWPALILVVAGLTLHIVGYLIQQTRVSVLAFFIGLYGLTGLVWGRAWLRASFFPFFLFIFCFPLGTTLAEKITFPMRLWVTHISVGFADLLGIDVIRMGTQIMGAGGFNFDVAPACSGIRSLTALLALTTIFGFLTFRTAWKRLLMVVIALPLAILGNVARISGVIVVAEAFGESAGARFHDSAGFVTFLVAIVVVLLLARLLREDKPDRTLEAQAV